MKKQKNQWTVKKILLIIVLGLLAAKLIFDFNGFWGLFSGAGKSIINLLSYLLGGFVLAYVLDAYVQFLGKKIFRFIKKPKVKKVITIIIAYITLIGIICFLIFTIIPTMIDSVVELGKSIPDMAESVVELYTKLVDGTMFDIPESVVSNIENFLDNILEGILNWFSVDRITSVFTATTSVVVNIVMSLLVSVYMLVEKEKAQYAINRLLEAFLSNAWVEKVKWAGGQANTIFKQYFTGKVTQALMVTIVAYIVFSIAQLPYAILFAVIIGITNMIPYIGPWIGAVPVVLVSIVDGFWMGVIAVFCVLIVQITDNILLQPKIIGSKIGISPLLVLIGLCVGGQLFGLPGMIIGDVLAALVKVFFYDTVVAKRLAKKKAAAAAETQVIQPEERLVETALPPAENASVSDKAPSEPEKGHKTED